MFQLLQMCLQHNFPVVEPFLSLCQRHVGTCRWGRNKTVSLSPNVFRYYPISIAIRSVNVVAKNSPYVKKKLNFLLPLCLFVTLMRRQHVYCINWRQPDYFLSFLVCVCIMISIWHVHDVFATFTTKLSLQFFKQWLCFLSLAPKKGGRGEDA